MIYTYLLCFALLASCSFKKNLLENQTKEGHTELYSEPDEMEVKKIKDYRRVVIASTNDLHGHYQGHSLEFNDQHNKGKQIINIGGVDFISQYFKILRQEYGSLLLVDSGDIFSPHVSEMEFVQDFYSELGYDALTIGLNDFNLKLPKKYPSTGDFLKDFASKSKTPILLSNLYELKTARLVDWTGTLPYILKEVNGVKIGFLGILPDEIVSKTTVDNRVGLYLDNMLQATLREARHLRSLGAEMIVVLTNQGIRCGDELAQDLNLPLSKVNFEPSKTDTCDLKSPLGEFLNRLPPNLIDLVIGGGNEIKTVNFIGNTLIMNGVGDGKSFSYAEFFFDAKSGKINRAKTIVHQPVFFCQEFFKETKDCFHEDPSVDHQARTKATFLGHEVNPDTSLHQKFHYFFEKKSSQSKNFLQDVFSILNTYHGDISFTSGRNEEAKLVLVDVNGAELIKILESDFNAGAARRWIPSPYHMVGKNLQLTIKGLEISPSLHYKILADIEDLQAHGLLRSYISRASNKGLHHVSWSDPGTESDIVSSSLSALNTVR